MTTNNFCASMCISTNGGRGPTTCSLVGRGCSNHGSSNSHSYGSKSGSKYKGNHILHRINSNKNKITSMDQIFQRRQETANYKYLYKLNNDKHAGLEPLITIEENKILSKLPLTHPLHYHGSYIIRWKLSKKLIADLRYHNEMGNSILSTRDSITGLGGFAINKTKLFNVLEFNKKWTNSHNKSFTSWFDILTTRIKQLSILNKDIDNDIKFSASLKQNIIKYIDNATKFILNDVQDHGKLYYQHYNYYHKQYSDNYNNIKKDDGSYYAYNYDLAIQILETQREMSKLTHDLFLKYEEFEQQYNELSYIYHWLAYCGINYTETDFDTLKQLIPKDMVTQTILPIITERVNTITLKNRVFTT